MPAEHGSVHPGGLRREHIVAAAMVAAVTVVLGFASGFGVREVDAAVGPPANPGGPVAMQPGGRPAAPPLAGRLPVGAARPSGSAVGLRPARPVAPGSDADAGFLPGFDFGAFPFFPPGSAGVPSAPPNGPAGSAPQCPPGVLDQLFALLAQVLAGGTPTQALADAGAVVPAPAEFATAQSGPGTLLPNTAVDVPVLLPVGDRTATVVGLIPLLDVVSQWEVAHRATIPQDHDMARPANPLSPTAPQPHAAPVAADPAVPVPGNQLAQLAALLAPVGLYADPGTGLVDALLAPVLGSLGCSGIVPATPAEPVR